VVEYALGAGLLVVALVVGIQWVQAAGEKALDRQAANIDYTSNGGGVPSTTSTSTTSTTPSPTTSPPTTAAPATSSTTTTTAAPSTTTTTSPTAAMTDLRVASAAPTIQWWNGKDGAWVAGVTFDYGWRNGATITLSVTRTHRNGQSTTSNETVYVNSGRTAPYLTPYTLANAASSDVVSVTITVVSIRTQDANWVEQTIPVAGPIVKIDAPAH